MGVARQKEDTFGEVLRSLLKSQQVFQHGGVCMDLLGRKNFFFADHEVAGENLARLYALVATCEASGVNSRGVLGRRSAACVDTPNARIGELLPHECKRRRATYYS